MTARESERRYALVCAIAAADPELQASRALAAEWRREGDHAAAGCCERDAASLMSMYLRRIRRDDWLRRGDWRPKRRK